MRYQYTTTPYHIIPFVVWDTHTDKLVCRCEDEQNAKLVTRALNG